MRLSIFKLILLGLFVAAVPAIAQADDLSALARPVARCTQARLNNSYMGLGVGAVEIPGNPLTGPFRRLFRAVFNAAGDINVTAAYSSFNGVIFGKDTFPGTYTVNSDCTVTINLNLPAPLGFTATFEGVLSADFSELDFTLGNFPTSQGGTLVGHLAKQKIDECSVADLFGPYAFQLQGTVVTPAAQAGDFARLGLLIANGAGGFTANTSADYNGATTTESLAGTYTLDSDCILTLEYNTPKGSITVWGGLTNGGTGADLLQISPVGAAIAGTLYQAGR